jgi:hypothetical protein
MIRVGELGNQGFRCKWGWLSGLATASTHFATSIYCCTCFLNESPPSPYHTIAFDHHSKFVSPGPHILQVYLVFLILSAAVFPAFAPESPRRPGRLAREIPTFADTVAAEKSQTVWVLSRPLVLHLACISQSALHLQRASKISKEPISTTAIAYLLRHCSAHLSLHRLSLL